MEKIDLLRETLAKHSTVRRVYAIERRLGNEPNQNVGFEIAISLGGANRYKDDVQNLINETGIVLFADPIWIDEADPGIRELILKKWNKIYDRSAESPISST